MARTNTGHLSFSDSLDRSAQEAGQEGERAALRLAHAGFVDVLGDSLIDSGGQGQVEEAVGLWPLVESVHVAVEALIGGCIVVYWPAT